MLRKTPESLWLNKIRLLFLAPAAAHPPPPAPVQHGLGGGQMGLCSTSSFGDLFRQYLCCLLCPELPWGPLHQTCQQPQMVCGWCRRSSSQAEKWSRLLLPTLDRARTTTPAPCKGDRKMYSGNSCRVRESIYGLWYCVSQSGSLYAHITVNWCGR